MSGVNQQKGFTLIELLIVGGIIAVLTMGGMFIIGNKIKLAKDEARKADLQEIQTALERYYIQEGDYPTPSLPWGNVFRDGTGQILLSKVAIDGSSKPELIYRYEATDSASYRLCTQLENEEMGDLWCLGEMTR